MIDIPDDKLPMAISILRWIEDNPEHLKSEVFKNIASQHNTTIKDVQVAADALIECYQERIRRLK